MAKANHTELFDKDAEPDMFGAPSPEVRKPELQHVRNRLSALVEQMAKSDRWPWDDAMVTLHRERTFGYLCGLLPVEEAVDWRRRIETEVSRLEAAALTLGA